LAIATIDTITHTYRDNDDDKVFTKKYLYINTMCVCKQYQSCAEQLMDNIKFIAKLWEYNKVVFSEADNIHMLEWYKKQGFSEVKPYDKESSTIGYNYHFHIK
jgi:ribosomal protein S18 acetylase RimI-like enzyme